MFKVTFNGGYSDFVEYHKSRSDISLRSKALGWTIVNIDEV